MFVDDVMVARQSSKKGFVWLGEWRVALEGEGRKINRNKTKAIAYDRGIDGTGYVI